LILIGLLAAFFLAGISNAFADWEFGGHAKGQFSFQLFEPEEIGAVAVGEKVYLNTGDVRLNTAYRRGPWDVKAQGQLFILQGNLLKARSDHGISALGSYLFPLPDPSDSKQVLDLSWTLSEGDSHLLFGHIDRMFLGFTRGSLAIRVGRQVSSWGNGLVFQVLDLFNPFPPNALDTEYKPGSDMVTVQWLFSNGDDLQGIIVPRRSDRHRPLEVYESSAAVKWSHFEGSLQLELVAARHYRNTVAGIGMSGNLSGGVWRFDLAQTFVDNEDSVTSLLLNFDRSWMWAKRNVYGFVEYFLNGFGETSLDRGIETLNSRLLDRLGRGEVFNLGRHELATGIQFEWSPLTSLEPTVLINPNDPSAYLIFRYHHDWRQNLFLDAGIQVGIGGSATEYGGVYSSEFDAYLAPGRTFWFRISQYF
jgi:hypothetical protein